MKEEVILLNGIRGKMTSSNPTKVGSFQKSVYRFNQRLPHTSGTGGSNTQTGLIFEERVDLYKGDCLEVMDKLIADGVVVDAIICDPPYGTTACKWDSVIPFDEMWLRLNKLIKPNGAIVLFGSEPFSSALRMSNIENYKYDWVWHKNKSGNVFQYKISPMKRTENICIFINGNLTAQNADNLTFNTNSIPSSKTMKSYIKDNKGIQGSRNTKRYVGNTGYDENILKYDVDTKRVHPTQKPLKLLEYLIKTYTNENETVLDFTMGSGTCGVACVNLKRDFIGIELDDNYFKIAKDRIEDTQYNLSLD